MAKSFPIPTRPDRFLPHVGGGGISNPAPMIVRDGEGVVIGDKASNPLVLSKPNGDCCCNDEIPGCQTCKHINNDLFESTYFDCNLLQWKFDERFDCDAPNEQTVCCRTFLPTPFAHVQVDTPFGGFYFPNSCFSMRVFFQSFIPQSILVVTCCIGVTGIRYFEGERKAETLQIEINANGLFTSDFGEIPCGGIRDNSDGRGTAFDGGYEVISTVTKWEDVAKVNAFGPMTCAKIGSFGSACRIKQGEGRVVNEISEIHNPLGGLGFDPPFTFLWEQFFDSSQYLDPAAKIQYNISPEAAIGIRAEHTNAPC